jgi:sulfatase maturation enzyme AslB (radical SAM superfamily)
MWNGEKVDDCFYCNSMEARDVNNPRRQLNERWLSKELERNIESSSQEQFRMTALPRSLEIRPGIVCNLMCVMCWSLSSSKVYRERKQALERKDINLPESLRNSWEYEVQQANQSDFSWPDHPQTQENVRALLPTLDRVYITGGEPTLIKSSRRMLEELLSLGRKDCLISFTTNLSSEDTELIELAGQFQKVEVTGSLDGYDEVNHYIRYPSKWSIVEKNIEMLLRKPKTFCFSIMSVIQVLNLYGYPQLIEWFHSHPETRQIHLIPTLIQHPAFLRPSAAPREMRTEAIERYLKILKDGRCPDPEAIRQIIGFLEQPGEAASEQIDELKNFLQINDQLRGTKIHKVFPELAKLLDLTPEKSILINL